MIFELYKISGSHSGGYEEFYILGYSTTSGSFKGDESLIKL
jgi:hypothetical protein